MKMRPPAIPLITVDPYFSVWSNSDKLNEGTTIHWTGKPNIILGYVTVDSDRYCFMGNDEPRITQTSFDLDAYSTYYIFQNDKIKLNVTFTSPLFMDNYYYLTRPVSYMKVSCSTLDGRKHDIKVEVNVSEEICLNEKGQSKVDIEEVQMPEHIKTIKMGNSSQNILNRCGDDIRIDWGYFYLSVKGNDENVFGKSCCDMGFVAAESSLSSNDALFTFAYDDIYSMVYFNERLKSYWNKDGESITEAISKAYGDYADCFEKAKSFSDELFIDAVKAGGEKYAELLQLALRQVLAAHKLVLDKNNDILYISKECFSNGCAATVDVSYPSIPMFLLYNPELIRGMMRPIFKYAGGNVWPFDFAPHDVGTYPFLNGQVYSQGINPDYQMPVEECGNMLLMAASDAIAENDTSFADEHMEVLEKWAKYLIKYGTDPENQLCTDDFAGHLAHNCNLSLKAIMGLTGLSLIFKMTGNSDKEKYYSDTARCMAETWLKTAANGDGTYKLAFDREGTFSMKYNMVWDKIFNTGVFPKASVISEFSGYSRHINKYGMLLDNRATYTKSDWLVWCATMSDDCRRFEEFIEPLWSAYNYSPSRVPMTDWYDTVTSVQVGFQHRTVQGGLFMKLLDYKGNLKVK